MKNNEYKIELATVMKVFRETDLENMMCSTQVQSLLASSLYFPTTV